MAFTAGTAFAVVFAAVGVAFAEKPAIVEVGGPLPVVNGGFLPKALPKKGKGASVAFGFSFKPESSIDGSIPSALREVVLELDRNVMVNAKDMAVCMRGALDRPPPTESCRPELVGEGTMAVRVARPEQPPFTAKSKLFAFNGGVKRGMTTIFIYAYLAPPLSAAVVMTAEVAKIHERRYGTKWLVTFPKIAGGYGSITELSLVISRRFHYEDKQESYLLARCPDGHLNSDAALVFADGLEQWGSFVRSCTPEL